MPDEEQPQSQPDDVNANLGVKAAPGAPAITESGAKAPDPQTKKNNPNGLEQDIRKGETWLIRIGIASVVLNAIIAMIYLGQLTQMQLATEASTKAANLASDALDYSTGEFDRTMRQSIHQTKAQLDAASAAQIQAENSRKALNAAIEQFRLDQRPWVGVFDFGPEPGKQIEASIKDFTIAIGIRNTGKMPALNLGIQCCITVTYPLHHPMPDFDEETTKSEKAVWDMRRQSLDRLAQEAEHNPERAEEYTRRKEFYKMVAADEKALLHRGGVLAPNATAGVGNSMHARTDYANPLSPDRVITYILGKTTYNDGFKGTPEHTTKFCLMYDRAYGQIAMCSESNKMD